jgi:acyl-CoA synthetase (AMP-forming)/AMP-acid ligase II/acyl carrier protein
MIAQSALRECVASLLRSGAIETPGAVALAASQHEVTYQQLLGFCQETIQVLNGLGIGRNDRVAMVLPNGLGMAAAFLAVSSAAAAAPLNPSYQAEEFQFFFSDLKPKALLVAGGMSSAARDIALERGLTVLELVPTPGVRETPFEIRVLNSASTSGVAKQGGEAQGQDVALLLHTSGTTSRPKLVVLTQRNLCTSAGNIARFLELSDADRCLNVMPLFHIHGLVGALLCSLSAGGSVFCTPGFSGDFFAHLHESSATWYTAVPTMHQSVLAQAPGHADVIADHRLRFIRSSSAALPPTVMAALEATFHVPVVEGYGMTEASHQVACNPLPPRRRKPGSVGISSGTQVAVIDDVGAALPPMTVGEIAIRGPCVTGGYEANPPANQKAFTSDGWFRTGDQGYLDAEGYLFLNGRLKELINRGGEKISPREIDAALLEHPEVAEALAFSVPHAELGEEVAAAVVLRSGAAAGEADLRQFLASRLSYFKVPRRILIVRELPKGPTGKLQRIGMAGRLGISADSPAAPASAPYVPARTALEQSMLDLFAAVLRIRRVGINDNFFLMGGESLTAMQLIARLRESLGIEIPIATFFRQPSVSAISDYLATQANEISHDFQRVLKEINSLSDQDAERLLQEESKT